MQIENILHNKVLFFFHSLPRLPSENYHSINYKISKIGFYNKTQLRHTQRPCQHTRLRERKRCWEQEPKCKKMMYPAVNLCGTALASHSCTIYLYWAFIAAEIVEEWFVCHEPRRSSGCIRFQFLLTNDRSVNHLNCSIKKYTA